MPTPRDGTLSREIVTPRRSLGALDHSLRRLAPMLLAALSRDQAAKAVSVRRAPRLSRKARASLVL